MENLAWAFLHAINVLVQVCSYARSPASHNISIHLGENKLNVNDGSQSTWTECIEVLLAIENVMNFLFKKKMCGENEWTINANAWINIHLRTDKS